MGSVSRRWVTPTHHHALAPVRLAPIASIEETTDQTTEAHITPVVLANTVLG